MPWTYVLQELLAILEANQAAPLKLAALFEPYLYLLQLDPGLHAHSFAEGTRVLRTPLRYIGLDSVVNQHCCGTVVHALLNAENHHRIMY